MYDRYVSVADVHPIQDMHVRVFIVSMMECMHTQIRSWFTLTFERDGDFQRGLSPLPLANKASIAVQWKVIIIMIMRVFLERLSM